MASHYWIKLYQEMLRDPKVGRLSDSAYRRFIELLLIAGENDPRDGSLPCLGDIAWQLRVTDEQLTRDVSELEQAGIVTLDNDCPFLVNFGKRQGAMEPAERMKRYRKRKQLQDSYEPDTPPVTNPVTNRNTETETETETYKEGASAKHTYTPPQEYPDPETEHQRIAIRTAITTQVKETMWDKNQADFDSAAEAVIGMGADADKVKDFGSWWKVNGHYKGKPALKSFMDNFGSYLAGEAPGRENGQHPPRKKTHDEIMAEMLGSMKVFKKGELDAQD